MQLMASLLPHWNNNLDTPSTILLDKLLMLNVLCVTADYEARQRHVSTESMQEFCCTF